MAKVNDITLLIEKLLDFIADPDPSLSKLEWLTGRLMQIEAEAKVGAVYEKIRCGMSRRSPMSNSLRV